MEPTNTVTHFKQIPRFKDHSIPIDWMAIKFWRKTNFEEKFLKWIWLSNRESPFLKSIFSSFILLTLLIRTSNFTIFGICGLKPRSFAFHRSEPNSVRLWQFKAFPTICTLSSSLLDHGFLCLHLKFQSLSLRHP